MRLLEYEAKNLLKDADVPVPQGFIIDRSSPIPAFFPVVLKSQVPVGGRGKLGGIVFADNSEEYDTAIEQLLHHEIKGYTPRTLLAEEKLEIKQEFYVSILIDSDEGGVRLIAHANGGVEIESHHEGFLKLPISTDAVPSEEVAKAFHLDHHQADLKELLLNLYNCFINNDATLIEINPIVLTVNGDLVCSDAKIELDDAAAFRHNWNFETKVAETNFVTLNPYGQVATIANGAGLAMATVDAAFDKGLDPANFLDIGGGANTASVVGAFQRIMKYPKIKAIIINIFAGITKCDEVAKAVIEAKQLIPNLPPIYIRLAGTNYDEATSLLKSHDIPIANTLEDCLDDAAKVIKKS